MKYLVIITTLLLTSAFVKDAVSDETVEYINIPKEISCLMGESLVSEKDYSMKSLIKKTDFFSRVATQAIKQIIKNKPYDQKGTEVSISLFDEKSKLSGYIVIKESYQQIDLKSAKCESVEGSLEGFILSCIIKNPIDNQNLFLNYLYKYKTKLGIFEMKVSKTKIGLLTKNLFACEYY